jgi:hypothetical protein
MQIILFKTILQLLVELELVLDNHLPLYEGVRFSTNAFIPSF